MNESMKNAVYGVICGDALGCPVQFESREEVACHPVTDMRGYGTFNLPAGSWTDDSSLTLALLASLKECRSVDCEDIMQRFYDWMYNGAYTPYGFAYDIGNGTRNAISAYHRGIDIHSCASASERNNGNGSLMRIMPVCVYCALNEMSEEERIRTIEEVSALTHAHPRAKTACGIYGFMVYHLIHDEGSLADRLQAAMYEAMNYYKDEPELNTYHRLFDLAAFAKTKAQRINSSGYVVDALEAAVWSLISEDSLEASLLKAVNLGEDTDTTAAIAGGLAGLYYGMNAIPESWLEKIQNRELIDSLLD
ncbi:MAG: ADP-ribosylglycohydrolase family protein [Solobacterium sp.]|nr:ADP-ribosylglycohydrolase family protein [Solobacterium sp.]